MKVQFSLAITSIILNSVFYLLGLRFFTLDDAYIVLKTSSNLVKYGEVFSYSITDGNTNALTSFLYYLISVIVVMLIWIIKTPLLESYTFIFFTLNLYFLLNTLKDFYQIVLKYYTRPTSRVILAFFATLYPILIIWTNGLETSLGLFLMIRIVKKLLTNDFRWLNIIVILLILTRPDLGISAVLVLLIMTLLRILPNSRYFLGGLAVFLLPMVVSRLITGEFLTSSISRVPIGGNEDFYYKLFSGIKNLLRTPIYMANFTIPHNGFDILSGLLPTSLKFISLSVFIYFLFLATSHALFLYKDRRNFSLKQLSTNVGITAVTSYLIALLFISSVIGTGLGEYNRYFVFIYVLVLILVLASKPKFLNAIVVKSLLIINISLIPSVFVEVGSSVAFNNQVLYPVAKKVQEITSAQDTLMLDSAGLISVLGKGKIVDVYGLGTQRYSEVHGDFKRVYELIKQDRPDFIVAWKLDRPTYYLDSAHYKLALMNAELYPVFSRQDSYFGKSSYPELTIYRVIYS